MQDSSTNVLHHFHMVLEGNVNFAGQLVIQKKKYFRGIGTGPLDRITGGGFGFGLEQNVRDAYNWLVHNYDDGGPDPKDADEIFVFGFSRGAYTARSLVGFIASYGILRHGAPLTVSQLWENYCILGRQREKRASLWEKIFGEKPGVPRRITELAVDPWLAHRSRRTVTPPVNDAERLLVQWSRRAKITYLGVYDTVGAIGWDALAIPGLKSKLALHHNMRPTTLIQKCRHALAIHENRSSFEHTPFVAYLGQDTNRSELERGQSFPKDEGTGDRSCLRTQAMWNRKIEQRWFAGAHSNIGGGYPDNFLAQRPLEWLLEGAQKAGLACEQLPSPPRSVFPNPKPRDSYAEFAPPLWTMILRAKRNHRVIDPPPEARANRNKKGTTPLAGFLLKHINEQLDDSVFVYFGGTEAVVPPNVVDYARRKVSSAKGAYQAKLQALILRQRNHQWPGEETGGFSALYLWALLAGVGFYICGQIFLLPFGSNWAMNLSVWVTAFLMCVDYAEDKVGYRLALRGDACKRAMLDSLFWIRAVGVVLFGLGAGGSLVFLGRLIHDWFRHWNGLSLSLASFDAQSAARPARLAGLQLLLQIGATYFFTAFFWVEALMRKANLGSTLKLQFSATPASVKSCLDGWRFSLTCGPDDISPKAIRETLEPVRESLWRDIVGFIPLYSIVLGFGSWLAATEFGWSWLTQFWFAIPVAAAVADYAEDICHLRYLSLYEEDKKPSVEMTAFSFLMTVAKFAAGGCELLLTIGAILFGSWRIVLAPAESGWRGLLALSITSATILALIGIAIWAAVYRARNQPKSDTTKTQTEGPQPSPATE